MPFALSSFLFDSWFHRKSRSGSQITHILFPYVHLPIKISLTGIHNAAFPRFVRDGTIFMDTHTMATTTPAVTSPSLTLPTDFRPIFVVGCERSGTTLMAVLLDRHPDLAMTPETCFFQRVVPRKFPPASALPPHHDDLLARFHNFFMSRDLTLNPASLRTRFLHYHPTYANLFRSVMEEYAILHNKPRAGEKTPFHLWQIPLILQWFPNARIVGMMRDGRDVVLSILRMSWTSHQILRLHCLKWSRSVRAELAFQQRYPDNFKLVRYEDLLQHPEPTLREVDQFLGLDYSPIQLSATSNSQVVIPRSLGYKADALTFLDPSRIGAWKHKVTPRQHAVLNSMCGPVLRKMNYPDIDMTMHSWPSRIGHAAADITCRLGVHRFVYNLFLRKKANLKRQADEQKFTDAAPPPRHVPSD